MSRHTLGAAALLVLGLSQMAADLAGWPTLKAIAAATGAAPAPKVFGAVQGHETFSARFTLHWQTADGVWHEAPITPERYARLRGPYNRRNAYGAALSYGPVLKDDPHAGRMFDAVARHATCGDATALRELTGETAAIAKARVDYVSPRTRTALEVTCR